jgi:large subunit ribosomal protein L24
MKKKALKAAHVGRRAGGGQGGGIAEIATPIHVSNVAIVDPKSKKASRIGYKTVKDKKVRVAVKSGQEI